MNKKVLVVDDDPDILDAIKMALVSEGFEPVTTTRGDEVSKKISDFHPDLIILDLLLSGSDGSQICREIKDDQKTKEIPIIMMSAHPSAQKSVEECGAESFLPKPFSLHDLLGTINQHIQ